MLTMHIVSGFFQMELLNSMVSLLSAFERLCVGSRDSRCVHFQVKTKHPAFLFLNRCPAAVLRDMPPLPPLVWLLPLQALCHHIIIAFTLHKFPSHCYCFTLIPCTLSVSISPGQLHTPLKADSWYKQLCNY